MRSWHRLAIGFKSQRGECAYCVMQVNFSPKRFAKDDFIIRLQHSLNLEIKRLPKREDRNKFLEDNRMKIGYLNVMEGKPLEFLDVDERKFHGNNDMLHELVGCDCIDVTCVWIGKKRFRVVCDDEGFFKGHIRVSARFLNSRPCPLVGNLVLCGMEDENGYLTSLTDEDVKVLNATRFCGIYDWQILIFC